MRWTDESHPKVHRCPTPASFSTNGHCCRMKPISPARKLRVLRRAPYRSDSPANRSLRPASPTPVLAILLRPSQLLDVRRRRLCPTAQLRHTFKPRLPSIEFA